MLPWGAPHFASALTERLPENSTKCFWPAKYDEKQARSTPLTPHHSSLLN